MDVTEQRRDTILREVWQHKTCAHLKCERPSVTRGLCETHYRHLRMGGHTQRRQLDLDDLEFLLAVESNPHRVAQRLGYRHLDTLQQALRRSKDPRAPQLLKATHRRRY